VSPAVWALAAVPLLLLAVLAAVVRRREHTADRQLRHLRPKD
jgi:hypothetical protein